MKIPEIKLREKRDRSIRNLHPWIFSGALEREYKHIEDGTIVRVLSSSNSFLALGHFYNASIAVKIFAYQPEVLDYKFWRAKIENAIKLRTQLGLFSSGKTSAFRLVNAEGDGMPGLIVDLYNKTAVIQFQTEGMAKLEEPISLALRELLGEKLSAIYLKKTEERTGVDLGGYLYGQKGDNLIQENSLKFEIDWERGQKTGFFLDQRHNRELVRSLAHDRTVLNCFSYSGGFSIYALKGGAFSVTSVEASKSACELCERNIELNFGSDPRAGQHKMVNSDCFDFLHRPDKDYDMIILDPPAFAKHRGARQGGSKGYESINYMALKNIKAGGILFTFSCSQMMHKQEFYELVQRAALSAGRQAQIIFQLSTAPCHPVRLSHPEGEYLKGLALRVL